MHFSRLLTIIPLALRAFHVVNAATISPACAPLVPIVSIIQNDLFHGGKCGNAALSALRLVFHDAMGFSNQGGKGGGADGSILVFNATETAYAGNFGTKDITSVQFPVFQKTGLSAGDFVNLAAAVGTSNCRGAPSLKFYFGRPPPVAPAPDNTVPKPGDDATSILNRFADVGFSPPEVVALLASHSIAAANKVDPTIPGTPFDSTVGIFDTQFFLEVLLKGTAFPGNGSSFPEVLSPIKGEIRIQSDFELARDPRTACAWQGMIDNQGTAVLAFKATMRKLQLLGQNVASLTDCSEVIPTSAPLLTSHIKYPPSFSEANVQISCTETPFPSLATVAGPPPTLLPIPLNG